MKAFAHRRFTATALTLTLGISVQLALATPVQADWISDKLSDSCSSSSSSALSQSIRDNIEDSMKRAEASIKPPSPVGDLGCLDNLMQDIDIDFFSGGMGGFDLGSMISQVGFDDVLGDMAGGGDPMGQICSFAKEKWGELTEPLQGAMGDLKLPSLGDAFQLGSFKLPNGGGSGGGAPGADVGRDPGGYNGQPFADPNLTDPPEADVSREPFPAGDRPVPRDVMDDPEVQNQIDALWQGMTNQ